MKIFSPSEVLEFAVTLEENGKKFYEHAADISEDAGTKDTFKFLADEETGHKRTFKEMLSKITDYAPIENYPEDYFDYLKAYVDNTIFSKQVFQEKITGVKDALSAIDFALQAEKDSIIYYQELKKFVSESQHDIIEDIIDEERAHYSKLSDLKEKILS